MRPSEARSTREHSRNYLDKIVVHNLLVTLRFVRSESLTTTTWFSKYIGINVVQTNTGLIHREIKIKISWIIYATPLIKLVITTKRTQCPRGEIGRHKGLKILALWECQFESGRGHH